MKRTSLILTSLMQLRTPSCKMKSKNLFVMLAGVALAGWLAATAFAKDNIVTTSVTAASGPSPIIVDNGLPPGTIHVRYTYIGFTFPAPGVFATVRLDLAAQAGSGKPATDYTNGIPLNLTQQQQGLEHLAIRPDLASFTVNNVDWTDSSTVSVEVPTGVVFSNDDGYTANGVLQMATQPPNAMGTVSKVIFFITLVHPTSCLKLYDFITQWGASTALDSVLVREQEKQEGTGRYKTTVLYVKDTQPGLLSDNVLVVNTCSSKEYFDLQMSLDTSFHLTPHDNPGNAVFTYFAAGEQTPLTFNLSVFGTGAGQQQNLCLANRSVSAGYMFLVTAKMKIKDDGYGWKPANLPTDDGSFDFWADVYTANSGCPGSSHPLATPHPATATLHFKECVVGNTCQ